MKTHLVARVGIAAVALVALAGVAAAQKKPEQLTFLSGQTGSSWYSYATGLIPILKDNGITATTTPGGGTANLLKLSKGEAEASFGQTSANFDASRGQGAFQKYGAVSNINNLALLGTDHVHLVCTKASGFDSWDDLRRARIAAPMAVTSSWTNFLAGLAVHGIKPDEINIVTRGSTSANADALKDRQADCMSQTSAWPIAAISETAISVPLNVIGISDEKMKEVLKLNPGFIPGEIPAGSYPGQEKTVKVYQAGTVLMTHAALPESSAYWIVKSIGDNLEKVHGIHEGLKNLTLEQMASAPVWQMHPGAVRYYQEKGISIGTKN